MSTTRIPRAPLAVVASALFALSVAAPVHAQQGIGGQAYRTSLGAMLLLPAGGSGVTTDSARLPSGRAVLEIQSNPMFGLHIGGLRLAPNVSWADSSEFGGVDAPHYRIGLTAGIVGFRLNFTTGRFRVAPFVDAGAGVAQVRIDEGGYFFQDNSGVGYQPDLWDTTTVMVGGGGGVEVSAILGPGLTLSVLGGYWMFQGLAKDQDGDPLVDPLSGMWIGAGVKLAFRDMSYYWRHAGSDTDPPALSIVRPQPGQGGIVDVGEDHATLVLEASDQANVDSVFVNQRQLRLSSVRGRDLPTVRTEVQLSLHPGANRIPYVAYDGAGNRLEGTWEIMGIPLDQEGPKIAFIQPQDSLSISTGRVQVEAVIADQSPVNQIILNGVNIRAQDGTEQDRQLIEAGPNDFVYRFLSSTNVPEADYAISVTAVDSAGNQQIETVTVHRADLAQARPAPVQPPAAPPTQVARGPEVEIQTPAEWAGGGTRGFAAEPKASIRVTGIARYSEGIDVVLANNARMSLAPVPNNPDAVQFSGFVQPPPAGSQGDVEILVKGKDGSQTVRTFSARTAEPRSTAPAQFENIAGAARRERWAVIIGVSTYEDSIIPDLQYADDDAQAVYDFFRSPEAGMGGIPEDHIRLLINDSATTRNIRIALTTFLAHSTPSDVIFLYIAGHGAPNPLRQQDLYILTHDTEIANIAATAISMQDVNEAIQKAYAYNKVLITDACHSAGMGAGATRALGNNQINAAFLDYMNNSSGGFVAFTASEASQLSQEGEQYGGGHGVFTYYFLQGLHGAADAVDNGGDGDQVVTLGEVMEYTRDKVRRQTSNNQVPTISLTTYDRFWPMAAVLQDEPAGDDTTPPQQP